MNAIVSLMILSDGRNRFFVAFFLSRCFYFKNHLEAMFHRLLNKYVYSTSVMTKSQHPVRVEPSCRIMTSEIPNHYIKAYDDTISYLEELVKVSIERNFLLLSYFSVLFQEQHHSVRRVGYNLLKHRCNHSVNSCKRRLLDWVTRRQRMKDYDTYTLKYCCSDFIFIFFQEYLHYF
uniref:Unspecified product n=1 Tax=Heterorhabditis bacteriophora TaxID=37862 RepID=A0A1I7W8Q4_HETBA